MTLLWGKRHHRCTKEAHAASVAPLRSRQRELLSLSFMGTPPSSLVTAAWMGRRGLGVVFARSEPALRCRVVTGREETHSVTLESVGAVQISKSTPPRGGHCKTLPRFARVGEAHSELGDARPLASHGASHRVRSCTKSPELPSVAIGSVGMPPTPFGSCQRRLERRSGGSEKPETVKETPSHDLRCITRVATTMRQARRHS